MMGECLEGAKSYEHKQSSPLFFTLILFSAAMAILGWLSAGDSIAFASLFVAAAVFLLLAFCFNSLTISIWQDRLVLRYGPVPVFRARLDLSKIETVEVGRTAVIDGWGIHYIPFRGWTFNLWGFSCIKVKYRDGVIRIGSNDAENLADRLRAEISRQKSIQISA